MMDPTRGMAAATRGAKAMEEQTVQIITALQTQGQQQMEQMTRQFELLAANQQKQQKTGNDGNAREARPDRSGTTRLPSPARTQVD